MNLTIEFTDGTKESFRFHKRADSDLKVVSRIERLAESQMLILSLDQEMRFYPMMNIKCVRMSPAPTTMPLPDHAIVGVQPIG